MDNRIKWVDRSTGLVITLVAVFAGIVSYTHIYNLAKEYHQTGIDPILIPLSVDTLILGSSLSLLYLAWQKLPVPWLVRLTLWAGIGVTVFANVMDGYKYGALAAAISAWPAVAFVLTVETAMQIAKVKRSNTPTIDLEQIKADYNAKKNGPIEIMVDDPTWPEYLSAFETDDAAGGQTVLLPPTEVMVPDDAVSIPSIKSIRAQYHCGQPYATKAQKIMRETHCDLDKAMQIVVEEAKGKTKTP